MVIATNKAPYSNLSDATTGTLRTNASSLAANELFLGFKPAAVCKKSGYLRVTGTGSITLQSFNAPVTVWMKFSKPGVDSFQVKVLEAVNTGSSINPLFSFHVDIPVGTTGHAELNTTYVTSHFNGKTTLEIAWAYINAEPDDVWTATFFYDSPSAGTILGGQLKIATVVAEYKEN